MQGHYSMFPLSLVNFLSIAEVTGGVREEIIAGREELLLLPYTFLFSLELDPIP